MTIVFLCGSLEPGHDGVGDYTRRLAGELIRQGHRTAIVALNECGLTGEVLGVQSSEGVNVSMLRLPAIWPVRNRFRRAEEWIDSIDPEWISLQFVPFGFHAKGLPFGLSKLLARLGKNRRWHVMFHELWVGMETGTSMKMTGWGYLQKRLINSLLLHLQPALIHTQTQLYVAQLHKLGFTANYLPLFSNIPNSNRTNFTSDEEYQISLVLFGGIHPGAPVEQLANEVARYAAKTSKRVNLTLIGRCGKEETCWITTWGKFGIPIAVLGEQPPERISDVLGRASIGLSTNPVALVEKSGTVAAMQAHGLPVLCVSRPWQARKITNLTVPPGILEYREDNVDVWINTPKSGLFSQDVSNISDQFVSDLCSKSIQNFVV